MALCHARYNRQGRFCAEIALILLPVWKRPPPSCSATTISYKRTKIVAIWQHRKRVLGIFSPCMQQKQLLRNFRSKIWPRHSLRRPRFPVRQTHFHYRVTFTGYIRCFGAITSHDLVTLTFDLLTLRVFRVQCFSCLTHIPIFVILWLSFTELRLLNIWSHFRMRRNSINPASGLKTALTVVFSDHDFL